VKTPEIIHKNTFAKTLLKCRKCMPKKPLPYVAKKNEMNLVGCCDFFFPLTMDHQRDTHRNHSQCVL
jgi:hypothetical protein